MMNFSIITASFNSSEFIGDACKSLDGQTIRSFEHIVIDGGSTDETLSILSSMKSSFRNVISEPDYGIYDALNKGICFSQNEIIGILHSDDMFEDEYVLEDVHKLFLEGADVVYGDLLYVDRANTSKVFREWRAGQFHPSDLQFGWMPPHPTVFFKRELLENVGLFDLRYSVSADYDHMLRILKLKHICLRYLPRTIVRMRVGGVSNRSVSTIFKKTYEDYKVCQTYFQSPLGTVICKNLRKVSQLKPCAAMRS